MKGKDEDNGNAACGRLPAGESQAANKKLCATCAHVCGFAPMTCGKFRDAAGNAKLTQPLRTWAGACGPDGAGYQQAGTGGNNVVEFPKAGRFA